MKRILSFVQYLKQGSIRKTLPDVLKTKQMQKMACVRQEFLEEQIDEKFIALQLEAYHDIITELISAQMYQKGFVCKTQDSILAFVSKYFPVCKENTSLIIQLFSLRKKIHSLSSEEIKAFLDANKSILQKIINVLKK
jgi:hypothetical protein